jgi:hypothetical protein
MELDFFAFVPSEIEPGDKGYEPRLAGFPHTLVYSSPPVQTAAEPQLVTACYQFDPTTFIEGPDYAEMKYLPRQHSPYVVRVRRETRKGSWETFKYRGEELVCMASGTEFNEAMMQTTVVGLMPDEPVDE